MANLREFKVSFSDRPGAYYYVICVEARRAVMGAISARGSKVEYSAIHAHGNKFRVNLYEGGSTFIEAEAVES